MTETTMRELVKPFADRLTRVQWIAASIVAAFFLGFVDTLVFAGVVGIFRVELPASFGVPTTFSGYFFAGYLMSRFAPREITWEIPAGILICALLFMLGFVGISGQGTLLFLLHYAVLPVIAAGIGYLGLVLGREGRKGIKSLFRRWRKDSGSPAI
ncbi:MAG: hypothetical protein V1792_11275 [Pseudomonadota bacterium]